MGSFTEQQLLDHSRAVLTGVEQCNSFHETELRQIGEAHNALITGLRDRIAQDITPLDVVRVYTQTYEPEPHNHSTGGHLRMHTGFRLETRFALLERWQQAGSLLIGLFIFGERHNDNVEAEVTAKTQFHEYYARSVLANERESIWLYNIGLPNDKVATDQQFRKARRSSHKQRYSYIPIGARKPAALIHDYVTGIPLTDQAGDVRCDDVAAVAHHYILEDSASLSCLGNISLPLAISNRVRPTEPPKFVFPATELFP